MLKIFTSFGVIYALVQLACARNFNSDCVNAHNMYRKMHGAPSLSSDSTLVLYAQQWCDNMASTGEFKHSEGPYGESLYGKWGGNSVPCSEAVKAWYNEIEKFDFNNPGFSMDTGHFTQVVWKSTTKLGCALCGKDDNSHFVVCSYNPPGNWEGEYTTQVSKKL